MRIPDIPMHQNGQVAGFARLMPQPYTQKGQEHRVKAAIL
jgi:hypothetical protein